MTRKGDVTPPEVRFWQFVNKNAPAGCWLWTGGVSGRKTDKQRGYGRFRAGASGSKQVSAHRFSLALAGKDVPEGVLVLHKCDTPSCVNPDHLFFGDARDNANDAVKKKRMRGLFSKGQDAKRGNANKKLNTESVRNIRDDNRSTREIAAQYNVSSSTIMLIKNRKTWVGV